MYTVHLEGSKNWNKGLKGERKIVCFCFFHNQSNGTYLNHESMKPRNECVQKTLATC